MAGQHEIHATGALVRTAVECPRCFRIALSATTHCLTGCAIGEVAGLAIASAAGLSDVPAIAVAVVLAFFFGYSLTMRPLIMNGVPLSAALGIAFASETLTIVVMEMVDNAIILLIPGAMEAGLADGLFWGSLTIALSVAFTAAFPVSYLLIRSGRGHARIHRYHQGEGSPHERGRAGE